MDDKQKQLNNPAEEADDNTAADDAAQTPITDNPAQADQIAEQMQADNNNSPTDEVSEPIPEPVLEAETNQSSADADIDNQTADTGTGAGQPETAVETQPLDHATLDTDIDEEAADTTVSDEEASTHSTNDNPNAKWYVVHTFSGHENKVATNLKQRIESEHLENRILDILVPTQDKIEIKGGKKASVKEKIFPGYILVKMDLDDQAWLAVRTTQGVTAFVGMNNKPTPISEREVQSIVKFMTQGAPATFKDVFIVDDTVKIVDGPFTDFIGKVESVDKEKGKVRVLVSIFGRETPVELDFLQVTKL